MPLPEIMQEFVNAPEAFSRKHLISPGDISLTYLGSGGAEIGASDLSGAKKTTVKVYKNGTGGPDDVLKVDPQSRICYADFVKSFNDDDAKNGYKVRFYPHSVVPLAKRGDYLECWYLPYMPDRITKMTLQPKPAIAGGADPDFFFTANLSGCSVFVSGDSRHPTIAHGCLSGDRSDIKINGVKVKGEEYLQYLYDQKIATDSNYYHIDKTEYSNQAFLYKEFQEFLEDEHRGELQIKEVRDQGSVFGWRTKPDNVWHIYLQRQARVVFHKILKPKGTYKHSLGSVKFGERKEDKLALDKHGVVESFFRDAPVAMLEIFPAGPGSGMFSSEFAPLKV